MPLSLSAPLTAAVHDAVAHLDDITKRVVDTVDGGGHDAAAHYADGGTWVYAPVDEASRWVGDDYDHGNWTSGFWVGALLRCRSLGAADTELTRRATVLNARVATRRFDLGTHDIGFLFYPGAALVADEHGDQESLAIALEAADVLARRAVTPSGHLQAFGQLGETHSRPTSTIDTMMNLPLLYWAAKHSTDRDWRGIAAAHADRTAHALVRDDGSTFHLARISDTGEPLWQGTFQGAADDSCWARGQAWAVAGYLGVACETGERRYADLATKVLNFYCDSHELGRLTPYDLTIDTGVDDSSAGAIVAYGLARTITEAPVLAESVYAQDRLATLLDTLNREALLGDEVGVLAHSCYSLPHGRGLDGPLPYGDYFYLSALALLTRT